MKIYLISTTIIALLAFSACKKAEYTQDASGHSTVQIREDGMIDIYNPNTPYKGKWKDPTSGCWYFVMGSTDSMTPVLQSSGLPLCDKSAESTGVVSN